MIDPSKQSKWDNPYFIAYYYHGIELYDPYDEGQNEMCREGGYGKKGKKK